MLDAEAFEQGPDHFGFDDSGGAIWVESMRWAGKACEEYLLFVVLLDDGFRFLGMGERAA